MNPINWYRFEYQVIPGSRSCWPLRWWRIAAAPGGDDSEFLAPQKWRSSAISVTEMGGFYGLWRCLMHWTKYSKVENHHESHHEIKLDCQNSARRISDSTTFYETTRVINYDHIPKVKGTTIPSWRIDTAGLRTDQIRQKFDEEFKTVSD